jgi:preprotein translocase subunit SecA
LDSVSALRRLPSLYQQRLLAVHEAALGTDQALVWLAREIPEYLQELERRVGRFELEGACRRALLASRNQRWSGYLEFAAPVREGIHLLALARESPLLGYEKLIAEEAEAIVGKAVADAADAILTAPVVDGKITFTETPWYRPGAT